MVSVNFRENFIAVNNSMLFLICGEIHYFRVPKNLWLDILLKAKRAGLNCVSSYIPWNWHEISENNIVFSDDVPNQLPYLPTIFSRNLPMYLELIKELGLYFIARPGPYICSEWDSGGHPNRLYVKIIKLRSLDKSYIEEVKRWYDFVLPVIARYSISNGGPTIMLQVENEYFWGDVEYLKTLYSMAKEYVKDIPIITNENWYVEGTDIANAIDDYPVPWDTKNFDNKVRNYVKTQPGMIKMFMELEGGWFTYFGSPYPTSRGDLPSEWTEILLKTAIGLGINAINIYMFYGGTNPGYYTGKYVTSSYDFEAPIREWGELSKKYYTIKRIALFIKSFNDLLIRTKPVEGIVELSNKNLDVFTRASNDDAVIIVIRNLDLVPQPTTIRYKDLVYPINGVIRIPQRNAKIIVMNYIIEGTPFKIVFSSAEPLIIKTVNNVTIAIFYGDITEIGEIIVESDKNVHVVMLKDIMADKQSNTKIILKYNISGTEDIAVLKSDNHYLYLLITSRERAERTWYIDDLSPPLVMISNIYFVAKAFCEKDLCTLILN
ncbi:MAG: beta-galactosidase [Ignisphaera sp.]